MSAQYFKDTLSLIDKIPQKTQYEIIFKYAEINKAHSFMEGNGRSTRIWLDLMLKKQLQKCVDWRKLGKQN